MDIEAQIKGARKDAADELEQLEQLERRRLFLIARLVDRLGVTGASYALGVSRTTVYNWLRS